MDLPLPLALRSLSDEVEERLARIPTGMNEYGFDPFGASVEFAQRVGTFAAFLYRHYFRVETQGIEKVPDGRVLLIANHAGNTLPMDGAMLATAMLLEAEPPRFVRAMAEFYLPRIPWWNEMIHRAGAVVGTPENCVRLLEREEAIMVFPEGSRGFIKPFSQRYKLQRFGTGFVRLALQTQHADRAGRHRRLGGAEPGAHRFEATRAADRRAVLPSHLVLPLARLPASCPCR